eukprot:evm.model.NODE_2469_length_9049_cov_31.367332.2
MTVASNEPDWCKLWIKKDVMATLHRSIMPTQAPRARSIKGEEELAPSREVGSQGTSACPSNPSLPNTDASAPSVPASTLEYVWVRWWGDL